MNHILHEGRALCGAYPHHAPIDWPVGERFVVLSEEKEWQDLVDCPGCKETRQNEADRLLGQSIRKLLESEKRELYPHAAESWHARVTLKRYDPGCDGLPGVDYRCHVGDDMCRSHASLDEAVAVALSGKYKEQAPWRESKHV